MCRIRVRLSILSMRMSSYDNRYTFLHFFLHACMLLLPSIGLRSITSSSLSLSLALLRHTLKLLLEEDVSFVQRDASSEHPGRFGFSHMNLHRGRGPEAEGSLEEVPVSTGPYIVFAQNACRPSARQKTLQKRFQSRLHICLVWSISNLELVLFRQKKTNLDTLSQNACLPTASLRRHFQEMTPQNDVDA